MVVNIQLPLQSVYITYKVLSSNSVHHEMYPIELYVIKLSVNAIGRWFSLGTPVSSTNKTDRQYIIEILLKVAFKTITMTPNI